MQVTVLFFAYAQERMNTPSLDVEMPDGSTVGDLYARFADSLEAPVEQWMFAVNDVWAPAGHRLEAGDRVAFIPPVSGG